MKYIKPFLCLLQHKPCSNGLRWLFLLLFSVALVACDSLQTHIVKFSGQSMGTTYHISLSVPRSISEKNQHLLQQAVAQKLEEIEALMSSYRPQSELMRFNAAPAHQWFTVHPHHYRVLEISKAVYANSDNALDISVAPLIDIWGFSASQRKNTLPDRALVRNLLKQTGLYKLELRSIKKANANGQGTITLLQIKKTQAHLQLNVSAVAKGYAVDVVSDYLREQGFNNFLVEIGGEVFALGHKEKSQAWRIGLEMPDATPGTVRASLKVHNVGIATSGDYRNYFMHQGKRYSHTINPRTGYPIEHDLASVTVIAKTTALADAWATALDVLGPQRGMQKAEEQGLAVYFIVRDKEKFVVRYNEAFKPFLER